MLFYHLNKFKNTKLTFFRNFYQTQKEKFSFLNQKLKRHTTFENNSFAKSPGLFEDSEGIDLQTSAGYI